MKELREKILKICEKWCEYDKDTDTMYFPNSAIRHDPLREIEPYEEWIKDLEQLLLEREQQKTLEIVEMIEGMFICVIDDSEMPNMIEYRTGFNRALLDVLNKFKEKI